MKPVKKLFLELQRETADEARVLKMHYTSTLSNCGTWSKHWNREFLTLEMLCLRECVWMPGWALLAHVNAEFFENMQSTNELNSLICP